MTDEKRVHGRRVVNLDCRWDGISRLARTRISDLSEGGCYVDSLNVPEVGALITVTATRAGVSVTLLGRVIYATLGTGFGLSFEGLDGPTRERLELLLSAPDEHDYGLPETWFPLLRRPHAQTQAGRTAVTRKARQGTNRKVTKRKGR